jgi:outer membrane protein assembly factor BamC
VTLFNHRMARKALGLAALGALSACSTNMLSPGKIDYKSNSEIKPSTLEVPPDLSQLTRESRYALPGNGKAVSSGALPTGQAALRQPVVAPDRVADIQMERLGNQRWLRVQRPVGQLWDPVRNFWTNNGFVLTTDNSELGLMETDWAENRAKIPQDFLRGLVGKVLDSIYSTGERDKFRIRLDRVDDQTTEIFVTHKGMEEVYATRDQSQTRWQPRPSDPSLEIEMMRRLMIQLGTSEKVAEQVVQSAQATAPSTKSQVVSWTSGQTSLQFADRFEVAWRRTSLALDRAGFTVEDRDRKAGLFYVRFVDRPKEPEEPGFFAKLFSSDSAKPPARMRIAVQEQSPTQTSITVQNESGQADTGEVAQKIARLIYEELK